MPFPDVTSPRSHCISDVAMLWWCNSDDNDDDEDDNDVNQICLVLVFQSAVIAYLWGACIYIHI